MEHKYSEISQLIKLQQSIISDGEIKADESGFLLHELEKERVKAFETLQYKYTYGYYIAEMNKDEQIKSLSDFINYILDNYFEVEEEE